MLTEKRLFQKEDRTWNKTFEKNLKRSIHRLHNETVKNVRKEQYSSNKELRIRNDISQDSYRKKER